MFYIVTVFYIVELFLYVLICIHKELSTAQDIVVSLKRIQLFRALRRTNNISTRDSFESRSAVMSIREMETRTKDFYEKMRGSDRWCERYAMLRCDLCKRDVCEPKPSWSINYDPDALDLLVEHLRSK